MPIIKLGMHQGWSPRRSETRPYPRGSIDDRAFIRAWVELHGSADIADSRRRQTPRLRIYGNATLIEQINQLLAVYTGLPLRRVQRTANETTKALYYLGKSMGQVLNTLYGSASISNPNAQQRIQAPATRCTDVTPHLAPRLDSSI